MKIILLALIVALTLTMAIGLPALAVDLELPNGNTVEGLPDEAENAGHSGVVNPDECDPTVPPGCG